MGGPMFPGTSSSGGQRRPPLPASDPEGWGRWALTARRTRGASWPPVADRGAAASCLLFSQKWFSLCSLGVLRSGLPFSRGWGAAGFAFRWASFGIPQSFQVDWQLKPFPAKCACSGRHCQWLGPKTRAGKGFAGWAPLPCKGTTSTSLPTLWGQQT